MAIALWARDGDTSGKRANFAILFTEYGTVLQYGNIVWYITYTLYYNTLTILSACGGFLFSQKSVARGALNHTKMPPSPMRCAVGENQLTETLAASKVSPPEKRSINLSSSFECNPAKIRRARRREQTVSSDWLNYCVSIALNRFATRREAHDGNSMEFSVTVPEYVGQDFSSRNGVYVPTQKVWAPVLKPVWEKLHKGFIMIIYNGRGGDFLPLFWKCVA